MTVLAVAGLAAAAAPAQQQDDQPRQRDQQGWGQQQPNRQRQQQQRQAGIQPDSVSIVGLDLDGDGQVDTVYEISEYDFQQAMRQYQQERARGGQQPSRRQQQAQQRPMRSQMGQPEGQIEAFADLPLDEDSAPRTLQPVQLSGTVQAAATARLVGHGQPHQLVRLQLDDGRNVYADLGPAGNLRNQDIQINRGDQIQVTGKAAMLNNRPVIFATRLETDQGNVTIQRRMQPLMQQVGGGTGARMQTAGYQMEQKLADLKGTVVSKETITFGQSEPYALVHLRLDDGQTALVNLGPERELKDTPVQRGDQIEVQASEVDLFGQRVFHAKELMTNGRTKQIQQER